MPDPGAPGPAALAEEERRSIAGLAAGLGRVCRAGNTRHMLVLAGSADWTLAAAEAALTGLGQPAAAWLSDRDLAVTRHPVVRGADLLGGETDCLVYDAWSGLDPDSLGAAAGTLRGGGLLLLLTPPLALWPDLPDPQAHRITVHPFALGELSGRYLSRFARVLATTPGVHILGEGTQPPVPPLAASGIGQGVASPTMRAAPGPRTADQVRALGLILATARGRAHRPLVITSDRGRGKSAVLGLAAAELARAHPVRVLVTAPRRSAVEPLFAQVALGLPGAAVRRERVALGEAQIQFIAPDALCRARPRADLLLVDEAAGIPAPLLTDLLRTYPRIVFATTVHGYEGSGRGFDVRFRQTLDRLTPLWRELRLGEPVRWAAGDPLEGALAQALLLDAAPAPDAAVAGAALDKARCERLDRDTLASDEPLLRGVFGLLVLAHYQTRPMDLRHLLDGPNLGVYALRLGDRPVATALVATEGRLDAGLSQAVFEGRRRARGHLLPQTLSVHAGLAEAPALGFARIVRIAVHPALRRRGLARRLLEAITGDAQACGLDLIGASFGVDPDLLGLWTHCGLVPAHLGTSRNAASGRHAAVVLRPLTAAGENLLARARDRLGTRLPALLAGPLRTLEPAIVAAMLAGTEARGRIGRDEEAELAAFAAAQRPFEASLPLLARLASDRLGEALARKVLSEAEVALVVTRVLQYRGWGEPTADVLASDGRARDLARLRHAAGQLLALSTAADGRPLE
ncbi:MAG: GNAT family N-acetyltransferase [Chromatiaceae bacterium]|jgi:tRNA(Met) cytidine acetyltransferase|nr:GNAT family N-acetyltransferase [Chromatiaceae bacterium]